MSSNTPSQLGRYEIQAVLGKGSMGVVYLARDPLIGRLVALKTFRPSAGTDDEDAERFRTRFLREAQSAGILSHPNIVTVHDVVEASDDGETFIAMEYVQGTNLKEVLRYGKPLEMGEVVEIFGQMAEALDYAHGKGVVHRDVKPANVLLTPQRQVKITDFGIARFEASNLTHDGQLLGTPNYMSPEQVQGREVDHRTDLFSLAVVLYEMIARNKPFSGENLTAVTHRIVYDRHTPLDRFVGGLPEPLHRLMDKALAKDPDKRFQSAGEMSAELGQLVAIYEQQIALSETQSIASPPPPRGTADSTGTSPGDATTPLPGSTGDGLDDGTEAPPPPPDAPPPATGTGGTAGSGSLTATGAGVFYGFRRWLKPEPGFGPPDWPRLSLVLVVVALLVAGFGSLMLGWMEPEVPEAGATVEDRLELEFLTALREGQKASRDGELLAAVAAFRRAEALKPDDPRARRMRQAAERSAQLETMSELTRERLALQVSAAEEALIAGRYQEALSTARVVLETAGPEPEGGAGEEGEEGAEEGAGDDLSEARAAAQRVVDRARAALARQRQEEERLADAEEAGDAEAVGEEAGVEDGEEVVAEGPAQLSVALETEGDGRLVVRVDGELLLNVGYNYTDRVGLFRRKKPYRGVSRLDKLEVGSGVHQLDYEVQPEEGPTQVGSMEVEFPAGETRSLIIVYTPGQSLSARVE